MTKSRRTAPPDRTSKPEAAAPDDGTRTTRTTIQVRPSWLEDLGEDDPARRTQAPRTTIEVRPSWLEDVGGSEPSTGGARASAVPPGEEALRRRERPTRRLKPPPLPAEPVDDEPARSAMPPPLPTTPKKRA